MDIPSSITFSDNKKIEFAQCNRYQRAIYIELAKQVKILNQIPDTKAEGKLKQIGVMEYLIRKLELCGSLVRMDNVFDCP